jgi:alkylation response protein AidB-like acyl-CoA dehydrogenase
MDFELTPEQAEIRDLVRQVGQEQFRPTAFERRHDFAPPLENLRLLGELGILGMCLPEEYGGAGRSELDAVFALEELARACPVTANFALLTLTGPSSFIAKSGTDEQKARYLPPLCDGSERFSISMTEAEAGSALTDLKTRAEVRGDRCVINGQKIFCSGAPHAQHFLVFVRFGAGTDGIGAVIVQRDTPGFTIGKSHRHISGEPWSELYFDDATIPLADVLVTGGAFRALMTAFSLERCGAAAYVLGVAQIAFELALEYVEDRRQFGRRLSDFQLVQAKLADMYTALESARLLVYRAILRGQDGLPSRLDSSAAKIAATKAACMVTDTSMQLHGGTGMSQEMPLEWLYRVVRPYEVAGGTSDVLRSGMAGELLGRRLDQRPRAPEIVKVAP